MTSGRELIGRASEPSARSACDALLRIFERSEARVDEEEIAAQAHRVVRLRDGHIEYDRPQTPRAAAAAAPPPAS